MKFLISFIFVLVCQISALPSSSLPVININVLEPRNNEVKSISGQSGNIQIGYELIFGKDISFKDTKVCIEMADTAFLKPAFALTCVSTTNIKITIQDMKVGDYLIYTYLTGKANGADIDSRSTLQATRVILSDINTFVIPNAIEITSNGYSTTTNELIVPYEDSVNKNVEVPIRFKVNDIGFDMSHLDICIKIIDSKNFETMKYSCLSVSQAGSIMTLTLPKSDYYTAFLVLKNRMDTSNNAVIMGSLNTLTLTMKPLISMLPIITTMQHPVLEGGLDQHNPDSKVTLCLDFIRNGNEIAQSLIELCADFYTAGSPNIASVKAYCLPNNQNQICLTNLGQEVGIGDHRLVVYYRSKTSPQSPSQQEKMIYKDSIISVPVQLRYFYEFTPTYEWQRLHEWHTIPNSIETRLPMSGSAFKEGRIPSPWRLQISMPAPCKYFLRSNIYRTTTISDIINSAGKKCKMEASCFSLMADSEEGEVVALPLDENVEETNLFSRKYFLSVNPECEVIKSADE